MLDYRAHYRYGLSHRMGIPVIAAFSFAALVLAVAEFGRWPVLDQVTDPTALPSVTDGLISGSFLAGAGFAAVVGCRRHAGIVPCWLLSIGLLVACQSASIVGLSMADAPPRGATNLWLTIAVAVSGLACVGGATLRLRRDSDVADDSFAIGLGMGLTAAGYLLVHVPIADPPAPSVLLLFGLLLGTHLTAAAALFHRAIPRPIATLLVVTLLTVGAGMFVVGSGLGATGWGLAVSVARAGTAAAWLATAWGALQRSVAEDRGRIDEIDQALAITREHRERLHELRSTVAGLVNGSELLDSANISSEARQRLWQGVRRELYRMQRLLCDRNEPVTDIDLDEALSLILELQRLRGRRVELHGSGDSVRARYDALAEVINILIDNAATHGGSDDSLVEVVRRDEETVDITVTDFGRGIPKDKREEIFAWGHRGSDSHGEGIGLTMAQRLMTEDGGSLRLSDPPDGGASFVISLPAVRRSSEDHETSEEGRVSSRRTG